MTRANLVLIAEAPHIGLIETENSSVEINRVDIPRRAQSPLDSMVRARWSGDQNNPNRDTSDPSWISVEGAHAIQKNPRELVDNSNDD